ncbi:hypothetical protein ACJX0J_012976, partial [Zea mays]
MSRYKAKSIYKKTEKITYNPYTPISVPKKSIDICFYGDSQKSKKYKTQGKWQVHANYVFFVDLGNVWHFTIFNIVLSKLQNFLLLYIINFIIMDTFYALVR